MKKIYQSPELNIVRLHSFQMLANSPTGSEVFDEYADEGASGLTKRDRGDIWGSSSFSNQDWGDTWE